MTIAATSRAFWPDPLFGWFARDPPQEHAVLHHFAGAMIRDAVAHGEVNVVEARGRVAGSASWLPPGTKPPHGMRQVRVTIAAGRALARGRNRITGIRLLDKVGRAHPSEPHWYLALLGVDPTFQGQGFGGALLRRQLTLCDETQTPAFLETQKPDNLPFYERFGFKVTDQLRVGSSPPVWQLWREPRSG